MLYLGWIVAGILLGFLAGAGMAFFLLRRRKGSVLALRMGRVERFTGLSLDRVRLLAGCAPLITVCPSPNRKICIWSDGGYTIALLFDALDICLGVEEEITDGGCG